MTKIETLANLDAVVKIAAWNDRHYITLANTSRSARGDSRKIWIKGNTLTADDYKGYMSDGAIASLDAVCTAAEALGMTVVR